MTNDEVNEAWQRAASAAMIGKRFSDVTWVRETGSTNADLIATARNSDFDESVLVCDFQSQGRGRRDRTWDAPPGSSLLMSVLIRDVGVDQAHHAVNAMALAAVDACRDVASVDVSIKWPNDLLIGGEKLAGILAEVAFASGSGDVTALVIGMGMNVNRPDANIAPGVALSEAAGESIDRVALLVAVLHRLEERLASPADELRAATLAASSTIGSQVRVELGDRYLVGTAVDLAADGRLIIESDGVRQTVAVGDVVHLR